MPTLAEMLPRVVKPEKRDIHTVLNEGDRYRCRALACWFESDDLAEIAEHVVRYQWQSR